MAVLGHHAKPRTPPSPAPKGDAVASDWYEGLAWGATDGDLEPPQTAATHQGDWEKGELEQRLAEALTRERQWVAAFSTFRDWQQSGLDGEVSRAVAKDADKWSVLVEIRVLLVKRLKQLDELEIASRAAQRLWGKVSAES
ncbi:MAG: hypothetical protein VKI42_08660 [Synechococcaceae cyanobacterium]|nr:hypothetical protein [Synechococcaceae cyanobacterium]